ncbi:nuclear transport factor 2 family protein [Dactylosporangium roseum]|uniref:Nuclear transport factor 2 family protein n=1 Tax=Dactylosporangium roseum TaxID=47989 RepID=A0ABY5ZFB9_9ACTN|nr:nuclear transport factor 2 family protein [Dactylosporangium roseum]UWZ39363.1 nuclear transport factor 2 family protein [Dactylosporangium roseum]
MSATTPAPVLASTETYVEVQQFYAGQVHLLDTVQAEPFAATFTEDAVFDHSPTAPPIHGRAAIAREVAAFHQRQLDGERVQRRHWFNMMTVFEHPDGTLRTHYYALIVVTRKGLAVPVIAPSCTVDDVLVREDGRLRTRTRKVTPDQTIG